MKPRQETSSGRLRHLGRAAGMASLVCLAIVVPRAASATPEFPGTVDKDLMLTKTVESTFPSLGCRLCHPTESPPASNPPLKPFGQLLFSNGARPDDVASLQAALSAVEQNEPWLITDLMAGQDPNLDARQPSSLPSPNYGCALGSAPVPAGSGTPVGLGALVLLGIVSMGRVRRGSRR